MTAHSYSLPGRRYKPFLTLPKTNKEKYSQLSSWPALGLGGRDRLWAIVLHFLREWTSYVWQPKTQTWVDWVGLSVAYMENSDNYPSSLLPRAQRPLLDRKRTCRQQYAYALVGHATVESCSPIFNLISLSWPRRTSNEISFLLFFALLSFLFTKLSRYNTNYSRSLEPLPSTR